MITQLGKFPTNLNELEEPEKRLLLYFEECVVKWGGALDPIQLKAEHIQARDLWIQSGFIKYGRIGKRGNGLCPLLTSWVELSGPAWCLAHELRMNRGEELENNRNWEKAGEFNSK